jgi:hypothetical protein
MRRRRGFFKPTKIENDFNFPPPETLQLIIPKGKRRKIAGENSRFPGD